MQSQITLVQGDTGPDLKIVLYDSVDNTPVDVSAAGDVVTMRFKREGVAGVTTVTGTKTAGGSDGAVSFAWPAGALASTGFMEAEFYVTFASGKIETTHEKVRFYVRPKIA